MVSEAGALMSPTPILDRQAPLPARVAPGSGMTILVVVWLTVALALAASLALGRPPVLRQWILIDLPRQFSERWTGSRLIVEAISILGGLFAMVAIHETGHVLGGLCAGFRFKSIRVGPVKIDKPFRLSSYRGPGAAFNGVSQVVPMTTDRLWLRSMAMVVAGPAANILSGLVVLLLPFPKGIAAGCFIAASIGNGLSDLLPFENKLGVSDGARILRLLRNRAAGERPFAIMRLHADLLDGVPPESMSAGFLARAVAVKDDSMETILAHSLGYSSAFHRHEDEEAARSLETCLKYSGRAAPALRAALMSDAAVFQGRRRKRADLAEQWLIELGKSTQMLWLRSRVEAAVLEARGDTDGAARKLDEHERDILALPDQAQRTILLRGVRRWKDDLHVLASRVTAC
jgi:hypothetical protein